MRRLCFAAALTLAACGGRDPSPFGTFGTFVQNQADADQIEAEFSGNLIIALDRPSQVAVSGLESLHGNLTIQGLTAGKVTFASLERIDGFLVIEANSSAEKSIDVDFARLSSIGGTVRINGIEPSTINAPRLETIGGALELFNSILVTLSWPELARIGGHGLVIEGSSNIRLTASRLKTLDEAVLMDPRCLDLPVFDSIGSVEISGCVIAPGRCLRPEAIAVSEVDRLTLRGCPDEGLQVPGLQTVGSIHLRGTPAWLPDLKQVEAATLLGSGLATVSPEPSPYLWGAQNLERIGQLSLRGASRTATVPIARGETLVLDDVQTSLFFPNLKSLDSIAVTGSVNARFQALETLGEAHVVTTLQSSIEMPALRRIDGALSVLEGCHRFTGLESVGGDIGLDTVFCREMVFDALRFVEGTIRLGGEGTHQSLRFPEMIALGHRCEGTVCTPTQPDEPCRLAVVNESWRVAEFLMPNLMHVQGTIDLGTNCVRVDVGSFVPPEACGPVCGR